VIYGLKLMEKLEPALFENAVIQLVNSDLRRVRKFAEEKAQAIGAGQDAPETKSLAELAKGGAEDSDLLSISAEKLMKLSKSVKQTDRMLLRSSFANSSAKKRYHFIGTHARPRRESAQRSLAHVSSCEAF